jgi:hypothetical protein
MSISPESSRQKPVIAEAVDLSEERRRYQLFRTLLQFSIGAFSAFLIIFLYLWWSVPGFPFAEVINDFVALALSALLLVFLTPRRLVVLINVYLFGTSAILFVTMILLEGATSPYVLALPMLALIGGELMSRRGAFAVVGFHILGYIVLALVEAFGLISPFQLPQAFSLITWVGIFVVGSLVIVIINERSMAFMQSALEVSQRQSRALQVANRQVQEAAEAERRAREHEVQRTRQLQEAIDLYSDFLERVTEGEYDARLDLETLAAQEEISQDLMRLGEYLNATVTSLTRALQEVQAAQRAYLQQSWEAFAEAGTAPAGYRLRASADVADVDEVDVETDEQAWISAMARAVRAQELAQEGAELAIPIGRTQLIGALGVRRDDGEAWSEDELALVRAVTDQLAQTIENLRLLDETTRRAAREEKAGEVVARIRREVEIEAVLERALLELGRALRAERGTAYLQLGQQEESA